jgi:hypothetical protein
LPHLTPKDRSNRIAVQRAQLRRLADLGMQLAETAASRALAELAEPLPAAARGAMTARPSIDYIALFAEYSSSVLECIALEASLIDHTPNAEPVPPQPITTPASAIDPRLRH